MRLEIGVLWTNIEHVGEERIQPVLTWVRNLIPEPMELKHEFITSYFMKLMLYFFGFSFKYLNGFVCAKLEHSVSEHQFFVLAKVRT